MLKRMVSAHAYPDETKDDVIKAVKRGRAYDILVRDPLELGNGAFDICEIGDDIILKVTDVKRTWMVFIEREVDKLVVEEG